MNTETSGNTTELPETSGNPAEPIGNAEGPTEDKRTGLDFYSWAMRNEGAFSMLLALSHVLDTTSAYTVRTKKQYVTFMTSLIEMLLTDSYARGVFLDYLGECDIMINPDTCEVKSIKAPYGGRGQE